MPDGGIERWDFEGWVRFRTPEEGGRGALPKMGYFPQLTYPDFADRGHFMARPVAVYRDDGTPYEEGETFEAAVTMRFVFLSRILYARVHRPRLTPDRRFDLAEGTHIVASGVVTALNEP